MQGPTELRTGYRDILFGVHRNLPCSLATAFSEGGSHGDNGHTWADPSRPWISVIFGLLCSEWSERHARIRSAMSDRDDSGRAERLERSRRRKERIRVHRASSFDDAERWDLEFWQSQTPQARLSALVAILRDVEKVRTGRSAD